MAYLKYVLGLQTSSDHYTSQEITDRIGYSINKQTQELKIKIDEKNHEKVIQSGLGAINNQLIDIHDNNSIALNNLTREIVFGFEKISDGIDGLRADFNLSMSEILWKLEIQQGTLNEILKEIRKAEFEREARAYRESGLDSFNNCWYNDALKDLLNAEQRNYKDFIVLRTIAEIYLRHIIDYPKALEYFKKTSKYAKPISSKHAAVAEYYAGLVCGLIAEDASDVKDDYIKYGFDHLWKAIELNIKFYEAYFWHAAFSAKLKKMDEVSESLEKAITGDVHYFNRINDNQFFKEVRNELSSVLVEIKDQYKQKAENAIENLKMKIEKAETVIPQSHLSQFNLDLNALSQQLESDDIISYNDVIIKTNELEDYLIKFVDEKVSEIISEKYEEIHQCEINKNDKIEKLKSDVDEIKKKIQTVKSNYEEWKSGFFSYLVFFLIILFLIALFGPYSDDNQFSIQFLLTTYLLAFLLFFVPYLIPTVVSKYMYYTDVTIPQQRLSQELKDKKGEISYLTQKFEKECQNMIYKLKKDIVDLEFFLEDI